MKKILALLTVVLLSSSLVQAKIPEENMKKPPMPPRMTEQQRIKHEQAFEQRLNLTDEQKQKSRELRLEGREKIKPVVEQIKTREQQMKLVKESNLTDEEKNKKMDSLKSDMKSLHKQAHDIRVENMKNFEDILNSEQKKTLKEMRQEGRQEFNKRHISPHQAGLTVQKKVFYEK